MLTEAQKFYSSPEESGRTDGELPAGTVLEVGLEEVLRHDIGTGFLKARLDSGRRGFIATDSKGVQITRMKIAQERVGVYEVPAADAPPGVWLEKGDIVQVLPVGVPVGDDTFVAIRFGKGSEGYIHNRTQTKAIAEVTRGSGWRMTRDGFVWLALAVAFVVAYRVIVGGNMPYPFNLIPQGLAITGVIRLGYGLAWLCRAPI
jgi:hypothetical protein